MVRPNLAGSCTSCSIIFLFRYTKIHRVFTNKYAQKICHSGLTNLKKLPNSVNWTYQTAGHIPTSMLHAHRPGLHAASALAATDGYAQSVYRRKGEMRAMYGENGADKSPRMTITSGVYQTETNTTRGGLDACGRGARHGNDSPEIEPDPPSAGGRPPTDHKRADFIAHRIENPVAIQGGAQTPAHLGGHRPQAVPVRRDDTDRRPAAGEQVSTASRRTNPTHGARGPPPAMK